ncbi:MAG TPA: oligosaccharide flippase family protein, partial [Gemmatimonadaceae bacterium]|nr:oligosaccharide flippase family protein [Gemmatimonadaceae bacterium]
NSLIAFVMTFRDLGLPMAVVQRAEIDDAELSALFYLNLRVSLLIAVVIAAMSPLVSTFYGEFPLTVMTVVMAAGFFAYAMSSQPESLMMRQMRFPEINAIEIITNLAGAVAAIAIALAGGGYWALVAQFVLVAISRTVAIWLRSGWRPVRAGASIISHRDMVAYGRSLSGYRALDHMGRHLGRILIGVTSGAASVGYYYNAFRWSHFPITMVFAPLERIAVSGLSRTRQHPALFLSSLGKGAMLVLGLILPLVTFFAVEPELTLGVVLGEKWLPAATMFRLFSFGAAAIAITRLTSWIYLSTGAASRQLRWGLVRTIALAMAAVIGLRWGAVGVAAASVIVLWMLALPETAYCLAPTEISIRNYVAMIWRPMFACAVAGMALLLLDSFLPAAGFIALSIRIGVFVVAYAIAWIVPPGGRKLTLELVQIPRAAFQ